MVKYSNNTTTISNVEFTLPTELIVSWKIMYTLDLLNYYLPISLFWSAKVSTFYHSSFHWSNIQYFLKKKGLVLYLRYYYPENRLWWSNTVIIIILSLLQILFMFLVFLSNTHEDASLGKLMVVFNWVNLTWWKRF